MNVFPLKSFINLGLQENMEKCFKEGQLEVKRLFVFVCVLNKLFYESFSLFASSLFFHSLIFKFYDKTYTTHINYSNVVNAVKNIKNLENYYCMHHWKGIESKRIKPKKEDKEQKDSTFRAKKWNGKKNMKIHWLVVLLNAEREKNEPFVLFCVFVAWLN